MKSLKLIGLISALIVLAGLLTGCKPCCDVRAVEPFNGKDLSNWHLYVRDQNADAADFPCESVI